MIHLTDISVFRLDARSLCVDLMLEYGGQAESAVHNSSEPCGTQVDFLYLIHIVHLKILSTCDVLFTPCWSS
jgi:hypothetical protein